MNQPDEQQQRASMIGSTVGIGAAVGIGIGLSRLLEREYGPILGFLMACAAAAVVAIGIGWLATKLFGGGESSR